MKWPLLRPWVVWVSLMAISAVSVALAESRVLHGLAVIAIFGFAAIKTYLVMRYYMELPAAAQPWRTLYPAWTAIVCTMLALGHVLIF